MRFIFLIYGFLLLLQKYRLHERRVPGATTNRGLWMYNNGSCSQGLTTRSGEEKTSQTKEDKLEDVKPQTLK